MPLGCTCQSVMFEKRDIKCIFRAAISNLLTICQYAYNMYEIPCSGRSRLRLEKGEFGVSDSPHSLNFEINIVSAFFNNRFVPKQNVDPKYFFLPGSTLVKIACHHIVPWPATNISVLLHQRYCRLFIHYLNHNQSMVLLDDQPYELFILLHMLYLKINVCKRFFPST